jgi:glycopeptide antibiotics resistance protein
MESPRIRRWAWRALWFIAAVVLGITFWPTPVDRPVHLALGRLIAYLHRHGLPEWITYASVESASNVVMFVPIGVLIAIIAAPSRWWLSAFFGLIASVAIELTQLVFLPQRFASAADVVANTAGALIGGVIIVALRQILAARRAGRPADGHPAGD